jgi:SOS response regulatory protein OraA/RecX
VRELKLFSATFAARRLGAKNFAWREKYDAFTVSLSQVERVCAYIRRQKWLDRQESYAESWNRLGSLELY